MTTTTMPAIGQHVYPLPDEIGDWHGIDAYYRDKVGTVVEFRTGPTGKTIICGEFTSYSKPDDTVRWEFYNWKPAEGHTLTVSDPVEETVPKADHDRAVELLESTISNLRRQVEAGRQANFLAREMLMQEAENRRWCSEFDEFVDGFNSKCPGGYEWESRCQEVDIAWEETYTVTVRRTGTATLPSDYSEDDLNRAARELNNRNDATQDEVLQAVRDNCWASCDFVDDSAEVE